MERGPKVAVCSLGVRAVLQKHRGHLSVAAGAGNVELIDERNKDKVAISIKAKHLIMSDGLKRTHQCDPILIGLVETRTRRQKLLHVRHHGAGPLNLHGVHGGHVHT